MYLKEHRPCVVPSRCKKPWILWTAIASPFIFNPGTPDSLQLNEDIAAGRFGGVGEIGTQLNGIPLNDPPLGTYYALAEEHDVPLLIHAEGIEAIEEADFLTDEQKRDILYNNAARFLKMDSKEKE